MTPEQAVTVKMIHCESLRRLFGNEGFNKQGLHLVATKTREVSKPKDMREAIAIRLGEVKQISKKGEWSSYAEMVARARFEQGFPDTWVIMQVMAKEDRIIVICGILPEDRSHSTRN
jgi:hypothetical protein